MHLEILVEERSSEAALEILVEKIVPSCTRKIHPHQGRDDLLKRLPGELRAYARWLRSDCRIVVVLDEDRKDCVKLKSEILAMAEKAGLSSSLLCRIAVEELEAWFFGDVDALAAEYLGVPAHARQQERLSRSRQDRRRHVGSA